jgi:hypothetical protein
VSITRFPSNINSFDVGIWIFSEILLELSKLGSDKRGRPSAASSDAADSAGEEVLLLGDVGDVDSIITTSSSSLLLLLSNKIQPKIIGYISWGLIQ